MIHSFIKALYDPNIELAADDQCYEQLIDDIESSAVSAQVYCLLKKQGRLEHTPLFFQMRLKQIYQVVLYQNMFIKSHTDHLLKSFEMSAIEVIPLKGVYFAEAYFGHIGARSTSDIDILIRKQDLNKAVDLLSSMEFEIEEEPFPEHFHSSFIKYIPGSPLPVKVEIHWDVLKETTSNFKVEEFWDQSVSLGAYRYVKTLSAYHTFYLMCLHGWRHNLDSLKHFLDIIQMIFVLKNHLKYDDLLRDAKAHQTLKRIKRTLSIVYTKYPMLDKINEFPCKQQTFYGGAHRTNSKKGLSQYAEFMDYQFLSYDSARHSIIELSHWLLPRRSELVIQQKRADKQRSYVLQLYHLYKQRCTSAIKAILLSLSRQTRS